jgi:hypothetical protein
MIGHETIGQQAHLGNVREGFDEHLLESAIVALFLEDRQTAIGTVEDMVNIAAVIVSLRSSHAARLTDGGAKSRKKGS